MEFVVAAGLMLMRVAGFVSVLPSVCEVKLAGDCVRGCGDGADVGFGDEAPDAEGEAEEDGRAVELPPSFARRFARICARLSSAGLFW